jgi:hypothetical protein
VFPFGQLFCAFIELGSHLDGFGRGTTQALEHHGKFPNRHRRSSGALRAAAMRRFAEAAHF